MGRGGAVALIGGGRGRGGEADVGGLAQLQAEVRELVQAGVKVREVETGKGPRARGAPSGPGVGGGVPL